MKTFVGILFLLLAPLGTSLRAAEMDDQLRVFATCAGRLSAVMEFQWLFDGDKAEQTERQRAAVIELIGAIAPPDHGRTVLHWRIAAKQAQYALLTRATFNSDPADAAWASDLADRHTRECTALILS